MKLTYTVSQEGESGKGYWYAHMTGYPGIPSMIDGRNTFSLSKRYVLENAAILQGLTYKDYMTLRKETPFKGSVVGYVPQGGKNT